MTVRALLFTDVVDSTRMMAEVGDTRAAHIWAEHDRRARDLLAQYRGREIGRGDGFYLLFDDPAAAARYALAYHHTLADLALTARAALHVGPVTLRKNARADIARGAFGTEVTGLAMAIAARVLALARGGQTLLTATAGEALAGALSEATKIVSHGHYHLKGVEEPVEVFELGTGEAATFATPSDVDKAYRVVRADDFWRPVREVRHNFPVERDAFVGRTAELRELAARFDAGARLLTVLGPGGTGKTRFVRRYGRNCLGDWPGGAYFCDLSEARSLDGIHFAVASALEVPLGREDPGVQLGHAIAGRGRCLVILDNFEQVLQQAPATLGRWLEVAREASFIVTSRERLHLSGEEVFPIEPLPLELDAIELFVTRARAQQPDFLLSQTNRAAVAEVVRLLDGLPLAIELAAARMRVLSPAQIVGRMRERFSLLAGVRGATARQTTLRAAIDWSWDLLTPWEQAALAQCSIFDGGFTLDAAEAVLNLSAWADAPPVMDTVQALVDKSLLRASLPKALGRLDIAEPMFGMYLSIHEYASQKLSAFGKKAEDDAEQRHAHYFARFGSDEALDALLRHGAVDRRRRLTLNFDNLVSACRRAMQRGDAELSAACFLAAWPVFEAQGPFNLAGTLGLQVVGLEGLAPHRCAQLQIALAQALRAQGKIDHANAVLAQAKTVARQASDGRAEAAALRHVAMALHHDGHTDEAFQNFEQALALYEALNDRPRLGAVYANFANLQMDLGRMLEARASYEAALSLHREVGNRAGEGVAIGNLATLNHELGRVAEAHAAYGDALLIHCEAGSRLQEAITRCNLGVLAREQGELHEAAEHFRGALTIHREVGNRRGEGVVLGEIGHMHKALGEFDQAKIHYDNALQIHREVGNRRFEGGVLGGLGELLTRQGQTAPGLQALAASERLLREVDDPLDLAKVLCIKGSAALAGGNADVARSALAEAESISARLGAAPASGLGQQIEALRRALD
jgi:predicted ATPase/class 3 adenylate cyclase